MEHCRHRYIPFSVDDEDDAFEGALLHILLCLNRSWNESKSFPQSEHIVDSVRKLIFELFIDPDRDPT